MGIETIWVIVTASTTHRDLDHIGVLSLFDSGSKLIWGRVRLANSLANFLPVSGIVSGSFLQDNSISSTSPFTWTTSDVLQFTATYEAA